jgi:hypothetical protein
MTGQLQRVDDDGFIRCYICGADAAGPCAKCRRSVCGDCCVLVQGAATQWAVCTRCESSPTTEVSGWRALGWFFAKLLFVLLMVVLALFYLNHARL